MKERSGHRTTRFSEEGMWANVIEHVLPLAGSYWYIPRGPVFSAMENVGSESIEALRKMLGQARRQGIGWIRIEPKNEGTLRMIRRVAGARLVKAPYDVQPREVLVMDVCPTSEELLKRMKAKTRYNIRLAEKRGVRVFSTQDADYRERFCDLVVVTATRDGIVPHPREHYLDMMNGLPEATWNLYVAEYEGRVIAANLMIFFGEYATYLHGASGDDHREVMAPYLLQWQAIQDAQARGCKWYDFGGVSVGVNRSSWHGITRFKTGFTPETEATVFPGGYDVVLMPVRYWCYRGLQSLKSML